MMPLDHMGVDYGSKLAGTTAAAMVQNGQLRLWQSSRGQDADAWLQRLIGELRPSVVYIDAPLTLPEVYGMGHQTPTSDFFYRQADREVNAMSPMFIGGLTARAIKLRVQLAAKGVAMLETYPSETDRVLLPQLNGYKKDPAALPFYTETLQGLLPFPIYQAPENWHQYDAILAWKSGERHSKQEAILYGKAHEGRIVV